MFVKTDKNAPKTNRKKNEFLPGICIGILHPGV